MDDKQQPRTVVQDLTKVPTEHASRHTQMAAVLFVLSVTGFQPALADSSFGAVAGDQEITLSGTGTSDRNIDNGSFGLSGGVGWHLSNQFVVGIRQSLVYASVEGRSSEDDFWSGATRGYVDYHFSDSAFRPFVGASLGGIYGDGVSDSGFAGVEAGAKYYVLPKTFILGRAEYQWFFRNTSDANNNFDDGAWAYTVGMGYNF